MLVALGEPNRLRIVELLGRQPRTVGEIAAVLGLRQPQVTKHVQTLERAGLVQVHPLGRRKVCALDRDTLADVARWADALAVPGPDDAALARYGAAIAAAVVPAPVTVRRTVPADPDTVWRAFTDPVLAARWWHPRHFTVALFRLEARAGGSVELVLQEGDGALHRAAGRVLAADPPRQLGFTLDPAGPDGEPLFVARHDVRLSAVHGGTDVQLTVTPADVRPGAEPAIGGLGIGWEQLLDNLVGLARQNESSLTPRRRRRDVDAPHEG